MKMKWNTITWNKFYILGWFRRTVCVWQSYSQYSLSDQLITQIFTHSDANRSLNYLLCPRAMWGCVLGTTSVESYEERKVATASCREEMCFLDKFFWVCCLYSWHTIHLHMEAQLSFGSVIPQKLWDRGDVTVPDYIKPRHTSVVSCESVVWDR